MVLNRIFSSSSIHSLHDVRLRTLVWRRLGIIYNYPPKGRWLVVNIYRDAKRRGIYPPLFTDPEGGSCFSIYQIRWIKKTLLQFLLWSFHETKRHFSLRSQNSEYPRIFQAMGANQNARKLLNTNDLYVMLLHESHVFKLRLETKPTKFRPSSLLHRKSKNKNWLRLITHFKLRFDPQDKDIMTFTQADLFPSPTGF